LLKPSKGNFSWIKEGKVIDRAEVKSITGFAAPYISLYAELTARENIQFISNISDLEISEDHISSLIDEMDVASFQHQAFGSLSSGQKQRVKLAVALVQQPEILILDEPGTNLDEKGFSLIEKLVNDSKSQNRFMVIASNNKLELDLCDQIINLTNS
jgi:ABC-type multidrug transport system ATPase subunit